MGVVQRSSQAFVIGAAVRVEQHSKHLLLSSSGLGLHAFPVPGRLCAAWVLLSMQHDEVIWQARVPVSRRLCT